MQRKLYPDNYSTNGTVRVSRIPSGHTPQHSSRFPSLFECLVGLAGLYMALVLPFSL